MEIFVAEKLYVTDTAKLKTHVLFSNIVQQIFLKLGVFKHWTLKIRIDDNLRATMFLIFDLKTYRNTTNCINQVDVT